MPLDLKHGSFDQLARVSPSRLHMVKTNDTLKLSGNKSDVVAQT